ncbi:MAG TPA: Ig-like domain-containing protein, partial [Steroidobacteraceae bacterium]
MRNHTACRWLFTALALIFSAGATAQNAVRISEIHYDNTGTDAGEAIEVSAPAGTDLTGWQIVLYNGTGGATYDTDALSGIVPATCDTRGVLVINYPSNGIQNGSPDGVALVDNSGTLIEFLSYEGVFAGTNGPANGITSTDIGVLQNGTGPVGESLARNADGTWNGPAASSFGACNDDGTPPPIPEVDTVEISPSTAAISAGGTVAFTAVAFDIDGQPINGVPLIWESADPAIATVSATGVATGVSEGDTAIFASAANGVGGMALLHVDAAPPPSADFRINEIHYDNLGTDSGEAIEIEGPAGANATGVSIVLYNGNGGVVYNTQALSGLVPATCGPRGVRVVNYPADGIQNGSPDAIALVSSTGQVI